MSLFDLQMGLWPWVQGQGQNFLVQMFLLTWATFCISLKFRLWKRWLLGIIIAKAKASPNVLGEANKKHWSVQTPYILWNHTKLRIMNVCEVFWIWIFGFTQCIGWVLWFCYHFLTQPFFLSRYMKLSQNVAHGKRNWHTKKFWPWP